MVQTVKRKESDYIMEQQIFLGGQVSHKHKEFMQLAKLSPDYADMYFVLEKFDAWEKLPDTEENRMSVLKQMIELFGEIDFIRNSDMLTRLSMIMGDNRKRISVKDAIDIARKTGTDTQT